MNMEDKYFIHDNILNDENVSLYGVFDGHGGEEVVDYSIKNIPIYFQSMYKNGCDIKKLFTEIFKKLDLELAKEIYIKSFESGSCCCLILIRNESTILPMK